MKPSPHILPVTSRRQFLLRAGFGFGALAANYMLALDGFKSRAGSIPLDPLNPLASRTGHHTATAKSVIFLFMEGGPSHLDLFDPKPELNELAGQPLPESFGKVITAMGEAGSPLLGSKRAWKQHGQSGIWVSDWLPEIATCVDDIA